MKTIFLIIILILTSSLGFADRLILIDPETGEAEVCFETDKNRCSGERGRYFHVDDRIWATEDGIAIEIDREEKNHGYEDLLLQ